MSGAIGALAAVASRIVVMVVDNNDLKGEMKVLKCIQCVSNNVVIMV